MSTAQATATIEPGPAPSRGLILRGILFNWTSLVVGALVAFILMPMMIRGLGQYYYGMWVLVMSVADQYGLLDLGMTPALSRFAGYFKGSQERSALDEIFSLSFLLTLAVSVLICVLTAGLAFFLPSFFRIAASDRTTFFHLVLLLGLTTAIAFPERMLAAYLRGIQRFDLFNAAALGAGTVRALFFVIALEMGCGILSIALITLGMEIVSFAVHYLFVRLADPGLRIRFRGLGRRRLREFFGFSVYAFIGTLGTRLITRVDSIVIGRILSVALIAPFNVASRLTDYFVGVFTGVQGPVLSSMSELDGANKHEELRQLFARASRYTLLLSLLIGSIMIAEGRPLLSIWLRSTGLDLNLTYKLLVILTFCYTANQAQLPSWTVIYARARHQLLAWLTVCEGLVNLTLSIYWGHRYGLVGIALGTTIPAVVHHLLIVPFYALRVIEMPVSTYLRVLIRPVGVGLLIVGLCRIPLPAPQSMLALAFRVFCHVLAFALISYLVAVSGQERDALRLRLHGWSSRLLRARRTCQVPEGTR